ncbi:hypothetical protein [uncultured Pseudacidovorax sp.]|uniref:hypothetical protein n=1 Tax=uncultured Pseudacidovorax sp. TaxID=679313 RepID=UPI0025E19233|nr:hypothetical protein [uncultured Pseudacidovorax sp.]
MTADVRPVSWWHIVVDLERHGYTHALIAAAVDVGRSTVQGWKNLDATPRHDDGERLIALWLDVTKRTRDDLPRRATDILSAAALR